nr:hypothetical protein MTCCP1_00004 [uncultured bacterium]
MALSALGLALFYRYYQIGPACEALQIRAQFLKKCKNNRIFSNNFYEFDLLMREEPFIEHAWSEFIETCFIREEGNDSEGDVEITIRPSEYLNLHDAEHSGLRIRWFHALSGIYVGVGLCFTFAGLIAALYFSSAAINSVINAASSLQNANDGADIQRALAQLLNTATFKFLTSLTGLGCSITLGFFERVWKGMVESAFDDLCRELERCTLTVTPEFIADRQYQKQWEQHKTLADAVELLKIIAKSKENSENTGSENSLARQKDVFYDLPDLMNTATGRIENAIVHSTATLATILKEALAQTKINTAGNLQRGEPPLAVSRPDPGVLSRPGDEIVADERLLNAVNEVAQRIEGAVGSGTEAVLTATRQFGVMAGEIQRLREDLSLLATSLAATVQGSQQQTTELVQNRLSQERTLSATLEQSLSAAAADLRALTSLSRAEAPADGRVLEVAQRIEGAVGSGTEAVLTATRQFGAMAGEIQRLREDLSLLATSLAATVQGSQQQTTALIRDSVSELATRVHSAGAGIDNAAGQVVAGSEQVLAKLGSVIERLGLPIDRLTRTLDQVEGKIATHLAAFDGVSHSLQTLDPVISASARALQSAALPLSKAGSEISTAMDAMVGGVDAVARTLLEGQRSGEVLSDSLKTTFGELREVWDRHEARFIAVDESVMRILVSIIEHAEAHGEALKNHVVAIDTHLSQIVGSLAVNIDSLQETTNDLTAAAVGMERVLAIIAEKIPDKEGIS